MALEPWPYLAKPMPRDSLRHTDFLAGPMLPSALLPLPCTHSCPCDGETEQSPFSQMQHGHPPCRVSSRLFEDRGGSRPPARAQWQARLYAPTIAAGVSLACFISSRPHAEHLGRRHPLGKTRVQCFLVLDHRPSSAAVSNSMVHCQMQKTRWL
jgi:hypothetical protein